MALARGTTALLALDAVAIDTETTVEQRTLAGRLSTAVTTGEAADTGKPVQVRYVIALPLAEPYVSEASI